MKNILLILTKLTTIPKLNPKIFLLIDLLNKNLLNLKKSILINYRYIYILHSYTSPHNTSQTPIENSDHYHRIHSLHMTSFLTDLLFMHIKKRQQ